MLLRLWILAHLTAGLIIARTRAARTSTDRGEALTWVVLAAGGAAIAVFVLAQVRDKGEAIVDNICTNADPTTC